jgi:hypothetical protein
MRHGTDPLARAYAILGLPRDCSQLEATKQYRRLVKRWHPDQFANDPQGQKNAAIQMREINIAFELVRQTIVQPALLESPPQTPLGRNHDESIRSFGRRLTEEQIKAVADSIGTERAFNMFFSDLCWGAAAGLAFLLLGVGGRYAQVRSPTKAEIGVGLILLATSAVHFIRRWLK